MTKILYTQPLHDEALAALAGGTTSILQQIISGLPLQPGIELPSSGMTGASGMPLPGLPPSSGTALPPGSTGQNG